jgi:hypothetical protein
LWRLWEAPNVIFSHVLYQLSYLGASSPSYRRGKRGPYKGSARWCPERRLPEVMGLLTDGSALADWVLNCRYVDNQSSSEGLL